MKFLSKSADSLILREGLSYKIGNANHNKKLCQLLLLEQRNFCAYTEKYVTATDSVDIEHFDSSLKFFDDDYYNYYAVLHKANILWKQDEKFRTSLFLATRFFQDPAQLKQRVKYVKGEFVFVAVNEDDLDAKDFLDFIGVNHPDLTEERKKHVEMIVDSFVDAKYTDEQKLANLMKHKRKLHFLTCLEAELNLDLSSCY